MRHLVSLLDLSTEEIQEIFARSKELKAGLQAGKRDPLLAGYTLGLLFEKQSLRTRVSFQAGMNQLGGTALYLGEDVGWGSRETPEDFAKVLSQYVDIVACRAKSHRRVEELAEYATCPVINALTDYSHPCQALADLFTVEELFGTVQGKKLTYVGDGNNVARSLAIAAAKLGATVSVCSPPGYELEADFYTQLSEKLPGAEVVASNDPYAAAAGADVIYTDVWASMGQEAERDQRARDFATFQVNSELMAVAPDHCRFLHCLPARRGEEVTDAVVDGAQSAVIEQAGNRLHLQKGLILWLLGK